MQPFHPPSIALVLALVASLAPGCDRSVTVTSPAIATFTADPPVLPEPGLVTLTWSASNVTRASIEGPMGPVDLTGIPAESGSVDVTLDTAGDHSFTLRVSADEGLAASASLTVVVVALRPPVIDTFVAEPATITEGSTTTLTWATTDTQSVTILDGAGNAVDLFGQSVAGGSVIVTPAADTDYTLTATGPGGTTKATVTVVVLPLPEITALSKNPSLPVLPGDAVVLSWRTTGTIRVLLTDDAGDPLLDITTQLDRAFAVRPELTTLYTLTAVGPNGSVTATITVEVLAIVDRFTVAPTLVRAGDTVTIEWASRGATVVDITGPDNFAYSTPAGELAMGTTTAVVNAAGDFTIAASGAINTASDSVSVAITQAPLVKALTATPATLTVGETSSIGWTVAGADALALVDDLGNTYDVSGLDLDADTLAVPFPTAGPHTLVLTATNAFGSSSLSVLVSVDAIPTIDVFTATPTRVPAGFDSLISWETSGAASVRLEQDGLDLGVNPADVDGDALATALVTDATFVLFAANSAGYEVSSAPILVTVGPVMITSLAASPSSLPAGATTTFTWTTEGGTSLSLIDASSVEVCATANSLDVASSSCTVTAPAGFGSYDYTLTVFDVAGGTDTSSVTVVVGVGPIINSFVASVAVSTEGSPVTLTWSVADDPIGQVPTLTLTDDGGATYDVSTAGIDPGSIGVLLAAGTYVFQLTAMTPGTASAAASLTIDVVPVPTITSFTANPTVLDTQGGTLSPTSDLTWVSTGGVLARLWELDATGTPIVPATYATTTQSEVDTFTFTVTPPQTTWWRIHIQNAAGYPLEQDVLVVVDPATITSFTANPIEIVVGETTTLSWTTTGATSVSLTPNDPVVGMSTSGFIDISATGNALTFSGGTDEGTASFFFPAGFVFPFFGTDRSQAVVSTNGWLGLDPTSFALFENGPIPSTAAPNGGVIAPFWDDLDLGPTGQAFWELRTAAGSPDALVIQWKSVQFYTFFANPADLNFEVILYEDGRFEMHYSTMTGAFQAMADASSATIGWENDPGTEGYAVSYNTLFPGGLADVSITVDFSVAINGSTTVSPVTDTTYTLTATGSGSSDSATVDVIVHPAAVITSSGFTPGLPEANQPFDISWATTNATEVRVLDSVGSILCVETAPGTVASGSCTITEAAPASYTYTVEAEGALPRDVATATLNVTVVGQLSINSLTGNGLAVEAFISAGGSVDIAWDTTGMVGFLLQEDGSDISPAFPAAIGSVTRTPAAATTYILFISDTIDFSGRMDQAIVTVYVDAASVDSFTSSVTQLPGGGGTTDLTWVTSNTASVELAPAYSTTTGNVFASLTSDPLATDISPASFDESIVVIDTSGIFFSYPFDGSSFDWFVVSTNGWVNVDGTATVPSPFNTGIPSALAPNAMLAPFWDNLDGNPGSRLLYRVTGVPGSRVLTIEWYDVTLRGFFVTGSLTFQARLYESGDFEIRYLSMNSIPADQGEGSSATLGWENIAGTDGFELLRNTADPTIVGDGISHLFALTPLPLSGTRSVSPGQTTTYTLCATGGSYTDCASVTVVVVEPGNILVSEVMITPLAVPDATGEWFEVFNSTSYSIDLDGWVIRDDGPDSHTIDNGGPLLVPAGGYIVLGIDGSTATNGGYAADYAYSGFVLDDVEDEIVLDYGPVEIDRMAWSAAWPLPAPGQSLTFDPNRLTGATGDNDLAINSCSAVTPYGDGDLGTPGTLNDACFPIVQVSSSPNLAIPDGQDTGVPCNAIGSAIDTITIASTDLVVDVDVTIDVTHSWDGDLQIYLGFEAGGAPICVELSTSNGGGGSDYTGTVFDDEATTPISLGAPPFSGSFQPEGLLSNFDGVPMNGDWTLYLSDNFGADAGVLNTWELIISF